MYFYEIAMVHSGCDADYGRVDRGIRTDVQGASQTTTGVSDVDKYHQDRRNAEMDYSAKDWCDQQLPRGGLQRIVLSGVLAASNSAMFNTSGGETHRTTTAT